MTDPASTPAEPPVPPDLDEPPPATSDWTSLPDVAFDTPPPAPAGLDTGRLAEYARLRRVQAAREADAKAAKEAADALEADLVEAMLQHATPTIVVDGTTVFLHTTVFASKRGDVTPEALHAALRAADLAEFITPTVSASRLAAYARELRDEEKPLPEPLAEVLNVGERTQVRTRQAGGRVSRSAARAAKVHAGG